MDGNDLEMTQVIHGQDDLVDEAEREIRAILKLHDQDAPAAFQTFHLKPGTNLVGRSRTCDVIIENYAVSKQHAIIDVGGDSCTIMDLGSQNKVKIGKRILKPNCQYNLDYNEEFCIAGLRARVLYDQNNGTKSDTGSDTCSESLLTAIEVSKDQEGADAEACDNADKPEPSAAAAGLDEATGTAGESKLEVSNNKTAAKSSQNARTCNSEYQSSGSFTMPEMPTLDYTQTDSSQGTEPYAGADRDAQTNQEGAGAAAPAAQVLEVGNAPAVKDTDAFLCAPTQPYSDATCGGNAGDTLEPATADQESRLNAETQPCADSAECPEVPSSNHGEIVDAEVNETDRLNAPTQAYEDDPSAEAERLNAPTQAYTEQDDDERLNAVTQPYTADVNREEEERLNAVTQPYAGDVNQEEEERLNAVTQPYAADVNQEEQDRLNAVTQSFNDNAEEDNMEEESVCAPTQPEEKHRRLLCGPTELSFVLCEASQPCRDDGGDEEEEEFCAPTQKDESPPLKVHALLKYRRERGLVAAEDDNDKTPPLSPKTTIDETPPPSPGFVPESDPEDEGEDTSMVTARRSPSIFNMTGASVYEDCVTPGGAIGGSPIIGSIGKVSGKRPRRGMSLRKPTCDTVLELPSQESTAGAEWMQQQQQATSHPKASKKLMYIEEADDSRDLSAKTSDASLAELSLSGAEDTSKRSSIITNCSPQKVPAEPQESADTNKNGVTTNDGDMPVLHMSEVTDLDSTATDKEESTTPDSAVKEGKKAAEACTSREMPADTGESPGTGTSEQACSRKEKTPEEDRPASESEDESSRVSRRKGRKAPPSKTTRTRRKVASQSDEKEAPIENTAAPARRSSGRQNAGSKMKSLLSLEKRTSASGDFEESALSQEANHKRDAPKDDAATEEPKGKAGTSRTRRGLKGKAVAEVPPLPPKDDLASASQAKVVSSSNEDKDENEGPSVKPSKNDSEDAAEGGEVTHADKDECPPKRGPLVDQESGNAEDVMSTASLTPTVGDGDNCTNATIDTCFSEPFPTFSEVMAECQAFIDKTEGQDEKNEAAEVQEETMANLANESKAEAIAPATSEPGPVAKEQPRASRSKDSKKGVATKKRKGPEVAEELPSTRCKATRRGAQEEPPTGAELLVEDSPGDMEQPEALQSPQQSNIPRHGRPPRGVVARKTVPRVVVTNIVEDTEQSEEKPDADRLSAQETESIDGTPSDTSESLTPSRGKAVPRPRSSKAPRPKDPKEEVASRKRKGPEAAEELLSTHRKATRRGAQEESPTGVELSAEDSPGDMEQPEALQSPQQSNIPRRGRPPRGVVGRKTVPRVVVTNIVEDTEQSEGEPDADRLSAQETESIDGTPSDTSESLTPSRGKAVPRPRSSKAPRPKDPKEEVASRKRKGPEAAEELLSTHRKATRRGAQEEPPTGVELSAEDSPGDMEQPEVLQSAAPQQLNKPRLRRPPRGAVGRKTAPRVVDTKIVEDTEQSEEEPDADRLSAQETESIEGTPLEMSESLTSSRGKAVRHPYLSKAPRYGARGTRQLLHQNVEQADEAASKDESYTDGLSAQDTESINGTPSKTPEKLMASEGKAVPSLSKASRRGAKNAKQSLQQDVEEADKTASDGPVAGNSEGQLQGVRTPQRGKASAKTHSGQDEVADNVAAVDVSLTSVESSQSPQTSRRGKRGVKHSQDKSEPPVQSRLNDSTQSLSTEPQSQTSRSSQLGRRSTKQPETQENLPSMETGGSQTESEAHSTKPSRNGRKGTKLSQEAASESVSSTGETNPEPGSADNNLQTRRTRRGRNAAVPSQNEQVVPTSEATEDPSENSGTEAEPLSSQTWRGRKGAKPTRNQRDNKNDPKDNNVEETSEAPKPPNSRSSKPSRTTNLSLLKRTAAASSAEVSVKMEPPSPGTSRRSSTKTAQVQLEETEQPDNSDPAEVSSKRKRKVTELKQEHVSEAEASSSGSTTRRQLSKMPALAPVTRKRDARRTGKKEDPPPTSVMPVLNIIEETSPQCSLRRVDRKRHIASMSFGVPRHESDDEASNNAEETLDEVTVKLGPKSQRKALVKKVAVKQEVVEEAPVKRGKRKADAPEVKPEVPQKARSWRDEQADSSVAPKKATKVKPKVLFTGIDGTSAEEQVVRDLGGTIATNVSTCTHLVTDKFRRTVKALCCIGKGTPIVDVAWIKKCQEAGAFVDHMPHMLLDKKAEKTLHFSLKDTLAKASAGGVLRGWSVHATPRVLPSPSDMKEIVTCAGGKYLDNLPARGSTSTTVVVSCKEDLKACARARNNGVPVVAAEFVLSGLLQHKLDVEAHHLE